MQDWFENSCGCEEKIIGYVKGNKKVANGMVSQEQYDKDIADIIKRLEENRHDSSDFVIQDTEPESKNTVWIRPVNPDPMNQENLLVLDPEPENYRFRANIEGTAYGVENAVSDENQLNKKNYLFDIIK